MIGFAGPVKLKPLPVFLGQFFRPGCGCELLRLFRRRHRFRKTARFGISGGQRPEEQGFAIMSQLTRAFGQTDRLGPIAKLVIGTGGQHPRQIVQRLGEIGIQFQMPRDIGRSLPRCGPIGGKGHAQIVQRFGEIWIDLDGLAKVLDRFIKPAPGGEGQAQIVQRFGEIRIDLDGLAKVLDRFIKPALGGEGDAQIVQRFGGLWIDLDGLAIVFDRFIYPALWRRGRYPDCSAPGRNSD